MIARAVAVLVLIIIASPAHANWLDDAWSQKTVEATGGPAVALDAQGVVLVLPAVTLEEARKAGLSVKEAITAFLDRYSPQCADVLDMNQPHPGLKVALSLERPFDGDGAELDGVLLPGTLFVTDEEEARFTVDYAVLCSSRHIGRCTLRHSRPRREQKRIDRRTNGNRLVADSAVAGRFRFVPDSNHPRSPPQPASAATLDSTMNEIRMRRFAQGDAP